jgi:serine-type D-Ala-D-Ala carboxypeptidase/endopeptidase (penicillin-binding protein 4)
MHLAKERPATPSCTCRPGKWTRFLLTIFWVFLLIFSFRPFQASEIPVKSLDPHISNGAYALQVGGKTVLAKNLDTFFIPASTIKVLTALMALEILGPEYRFATRLFYDTNKVLYIRGEGDPFLTSEVIARIASLLQQKGITEISEIVLDDSTFAVEGPPPGSENTINPYDAGSSALAVNFNALPFVVTGSGTVVSAEGQTPLLPIMVDIGASFSRGSHRVNVGAFPDAEGHSNTIRYSGELITALFQQEGLQIKRGYRRGVTSPDARVVLLHESEKTVADLVRLCLRYSSNFIANQLYLSCAARIYGFPATWEKAGDMGRKFIDLRLPFARQGIHMEDGSGLSSNNRITPRAMLMVLDKFLPYVALLRNEGNISLKSGTLSGVYSYVGYFNTAGRISPFVLFLNQKQNNRKLLLRLLEMEYQRLSSL